MCRLRLVSIAALACGIVVPFAKAASSCSTPANPPACSYTALNGACSITVNRMWPVTPPTIYVKRGCAVQVKVTDPYLLENLTLDWKSTTSVVPPDTFQTIFGSLSGNLGKIVLLPQGGEKAAHEIPKLDCEDRRGECASVADIAAAQQRVENVIKTIDPLTLAAPAITSFKGALQPPPGGPASKSEPWINTQAWKDKTAKDLQAAMTKYDDPAILKQLRQKIANLDGDIKTLKAGGTTDAASVGTLEDNQKGLKVEVKALPAAVPKLNVLERTLRLTELTSGGITGNATIPDTNSDKQDYQVQTWVLNYTNVLAPVAKRVAADTLKTASDALLSSLADASTKLPVVTITVQFESPPRVEAAAGVMVPFTPYHSYSAAASGTGSIVQETKTYVVVPMAFVNVLAKEWIVKKQRSAVFGTGGIGYNPSTTAVEFGVGGTYAYRAFEISCLADIGRDTKLGGGYNVNDSLPASTAPPTSTYWSVRWAGGISIRIPLGGGSSSSSGGGSN